MRKCGSQYDNLAARTAKFRTYAASQRRAFANEMKIHSLHRSFFIALFFAIGSTPAHAQLVFRPPAQTPGIVAQTPLATDLAAPIVPMPQTVTSGDFAQATINQVPILTRLQAWRETMRGRGPQFVWMPFDEARVQIGQQSLPANSLLNAGAAPAISARLGRIEVGSTAPLLALNQSLRDVDELLDGQAAGFDQSRLSWISAKALQSKTIELNLLAASGQRDLTPSRETDKSIIGGDWMGASGRLTLASDWKLSGEWMRSQLDEGNEATKWQAALAGPISHPWGVAKLNASRKETQNGFAAWRDGREQSGHAEQEIALQQELALGDLSGSARVELGQRFWTDEAGWTSGDPANTMLESAARLRWKLSPSLALTGSHRRRDAWRQLPSTIYDNSEYSAAARIENEAGAEWKLSSSLALTASAGQTRAQSELAWDARDTYAPFALRDEDRLSWGLRHRTKGGSWQLKMTQSAATDPFDDDSQIQSGALRLEAERQLFPWLRLKGGLDRDESWSLKDWAATEQWRRRAEANLSLADLGRLSLRYGDSFRPGAAPSDGREYGVGYKIGQGAGLSLSMEYSRRLENQRREDEKWRVGLTYR